MNVRNKILTTIGLLAFLLPLSGQDLDSVLFTVGTTVEDSDGDGEAWVYLLWQTEDLQQLQDKTYAIYSKAGSSTSLAPFVFEGIARTRLDPTAIEALILRGIALGDDPIEMESNIDNLFELLVPDPSLPLPDKISAVVAGCLEDPELFENLIFLSRTHPTLSLVLGTGFAVEHPDTQLRTWEIRDCPVGYSGADDCTSVVGRVTLQVGVVKPLPPTYRPVYVPFTDDSGNPDPRAHLNVPLRWGTPNALRERALLQFGHNIYRMTEADALNGGFDSVPPSPQFLRELADDPDHSATRVNGAAILTDRLLDQSEAANTAADPETYFYIDDNDRFDPGGIPFANGDTYYYFVTPRDILGRDGQVSDGTLVKICDFQPPPQPKQLNVTNHYTFDPSTDTNTQHFKVEWEAPDLTRTQTPESIANYLVYRWWTIEEMQENDPFPYDSATAIAGGLVAILGPNERSFIDNGSNAPFLSVERLSNGDTIVNQSFANKTFWYTVRALDGSACGGNLSGNSAPAYGVLRDRIGPEKSTGSITLTCYGLVVRAIDPVERGEVFPAEDIPENPVYLTLEGSRLDSFVEWVQFGQLNPGNGVTTPLIPRYEFKETENSHRIQVVLPQSSLNEPLYLVCRMGSVTGRTSSWVQQAIPFADDPDPAFKVNWTGESPEVQTTFDPDCDFHITFGPGGSFNPPGLDFTLTEGTEEWKLYRRINDGQLTLIAQGLDSYAAGVLVKILQDLQMPAQEARICYFVQLFDQHGNPSPMEPLGCIEVQGKESLPTPMLLGPVSAGTDMDPSAIMTWFCSTYGVDRFELFVSTESGDLPTDIGDLFETPGAAVTQDGRVWQPFTSQRVPIAFPSGEPEFSTLLEGISTGEKYTFKIRALSANGTKGPFSNEETLTWNPDTAPTVSGPNVPWPALGAPAVKTTFNADILARLTPLWLHDGGSVRIGELDYGSLQFSLTEDLPYLFIFPPSITEVEQAIYKNQNDDLLFPFVLYRYQVANTLYPKVSGDVYQVSPMLESIAVTLKVWPTNGLPAFENHDPFFFIADSITQPDRNIYDLLVKDTQPLVTGADYRYLIVRFDPVTREIAEIIPTNMITIP